VCQARVTNCEPVYDYRIQIFGSYVKCESQNHRSKFTVTEQKSSFFIVDCTLQCDIFHGSTLRRDIVLVVLLSFCGKVIGATSTEGFLLDLDHRITTYIYITLYIPLTGNQLLLVATNQSVFLPVQEILISYPDAGQSPRWTQVGLMLLISGAWEDDPNGSPSRELEENTRASQYHVAEHHPTRPESLQPYTELSSWPGPEPPSV